MNGLTQKIKTYTLVNDARISIEIINLGSIITSIKTPDRNGSVEDIVLGFGRPEQYLGTHPYFGAILGWFADRIAHEIFTSKTFFRFSVK